MDEILYKMYYRTAIFHNKALPEIYYAKILQRMKCLKDDIVTPETIFIL